MKILIADDDAISRRLTQKTLPRYTKSASQLDFTKLLPDIVIIADEVDAQLKQQMLRYMAAKAV
jgi:CheY-like chemotaxis protein